MKPKSLPALALLVTLGFTVAPHTACAQNTDPNVNLTLDGATDGTDPLLPAVQAVMQGDTVYFTGTLTNKTSNTLTVSILSNQNNSAFKSGIADALIYSNGTNGTLRTLAPGASYVGIVAYIDTGHNGSGQSALTPVGTYSAAGSFSSPHSTRDFRDSRVPHRVAPTVGRESDSEN